MVCHVADDLVIKALLMNITQQIICSVFIGIMISLCSQEVSITCALLYDTAC